MSSDAARHQRFGFSGNGLSPVRHPTIITWTDDQLYVGTNFIQNTKLFIQENAFGNVVWKMPVILFSFNVFKLVKNFQEKAFGYIVCSDQPYWIQSLVYQAMFRASYYGQC